MTARRQCWLAVAALPSRKLSVRRQLLAAAAAAAAAAMAVDLVTAVSAAVALLQWARGRGTEAPAVAAALPLGCWRRASKCPGTPRIVCSQKTQVRKGEPVQGIGLRRLRLDDGGFGAGTWGRRRGASTSALCLVLLWFGT